MKESDWKLFKKIREQALDKYCHDALLRFANIIENNEKSAHDRFGDIYKTVLASDKKLGKMFDGLSRRDAFLQLMMMRKEGIANQELVSQLSEEFQRQSDPNIFANKL